ncbi:MAG: MmgE/PrpD family protein [Acidimicrobiales bacterium]
MAPTAESLTSALAGRSSSLEFAGLPADVVELASLCLLDWLGVTLAGSGEAPARIVFDALDGGGTGAGVSVVGRPERLRPLDAALVNGTASHALDFDDVNMVMVGHPSVAVLGAALALGEELGSRGADLLAAFVAGYETMCRVAAAIGPGPYGRGAHSTGTVGTFGAAAACASLLRLDAARTAQALGLAATQAAGLKSMFGTMAKPLHAGKACYNGLLAAQLAAGGFTAHPAAVEADQGFAAVAGGECDLEAALADPPSGWHVRGNLWKHHASCYMTHSTIEGIRDLRLSSQVAAAEVEEVVVHASPMELGACAIPEPATVLQVKFSLAHLAAMSLLGRPTDVIAEADVRDGEVTALRRRVKVVPDGRPGAPTVVEVYSRGGRRCTAAHDVNRPETDVAALRRRLLAKFETLAAPVLGDDRAGELSQAALRFGPADEVAALMALTH